MRQTFLRSSPNSCQAPTDSKVQVACLVAICSVEEGSRRAIRKRQRRLNLARRSPNEVVKPRRRSKKRLCHSHPPLLVVQGRSEQPTRRANLVQGLADDTAFYPSRKLTFSGINRARKPKSLIAMLRPLKTTLLLVRLPPNRRQDLSL
jgi:hypothetical protein